MLLSAEATLRVEPSSRSAGVQAVVIELQIERVVVVQHEVGTCEHRCGIAVPYRLLLQGSQRGRNIRGWRLRRKLGPIRDVQVILLGADVIEDLVLLDRSAEGATELVLRVIERVAKGVRRTQRRWPANVEGFAAQLVAAFLGDDVDEAGVGVADFGSGAGAHDLKLAHYRLREEERCIPRSALTALQRVLKVTPSIAAAVASGRWPAMTTPL